MDITYKNRKLERVCRDSRVAEKTYGRMMAFKIMQRLEELSAADSVDMLLRFHIGRCHALTQNRRGQYAMDLVHPYRMIFEEYGDVFKVVMIMEIVDYH